MKFNADNPYKWIKNIPTGTHIIEVEVNNIPLLRQFFDNYILKYQEKTSVIPAQLISTPEIGKYEVIIHEHNRELIKCSHDKKSIPRSNIDSMGEELVLDKSKHSLSGIRAYVYTNYTGRISIHVTNEEITLRRKEKDTSNALNKFIRESIQSNKLPAIVNCQKNQIPYVRNLISGYNKENKRIKASSIDTGVIIYDLSEIILSAKIEGPGNKEGTLDI